LPAAQYKSRSSKITAQSDSICALQLTRPEKPRRVKIDGYARGGHKHRTVTERVSRFAA